MTVLGPVIASTLASMSNNGQLPIAWHQSTDAFTLQLGSRTLKVSLAEACGCDEDSANEAPAASPLLHAILQDACEDDPNQAAEADGAANLSDAIAETDPPNTEARLSTTATVTDPTGIDFEPHTMPADTHPAEALADSAEETSEDQASSPETADASDDSRPILAADADETQEVSNDLPEPTASADAPAVTASAEVANGNVEDQSDDSVKSERPTQSAPPDSDSDSSPADVTLPTEPEFVLAMRSAVERRLNWLSAQVHQLLQDVQP